MGITYLADDCVGDNLDVGRDVVGAWTVAEDENCIGFSDAVRSPVPGGVGSSTGLEPFCGAGSAGYRGIR